ncbi:MAG TPA: hypothetical protein VKZ79_08630 [Alphaproteobacteria bacterium]|nr:hypothetical protein [Alphaproteobacteria bacterium]
MAKQFDVFVNPLRDRARYPLVVILQSPFADLAKTRDRRTGNSPERWTICSMTTPEPNSATQDEDGLLGELRARARPWSIRITA